MKNRQHKADENLQEFEVDVAWIVGIIASYGELAGVLGKLSWNSKVLS